MNLFALTRDYQAAFDAAIDPETGEILTDTAALDALADALDAKALAVAAHVRNLEAEAEAVKAAAKQMQERAARITKQAEHWRQYLTDNLLLAGVTEVKDARMQVRVKHNPPSVAVIDAQAIPAAYMRYPEPPPAAPDKAAIKAAIQAGETVPGCQLIRAIKVEIK